MKKIIYLMFVVVISFSGCSTLKVKQIGKMNMISNRNVNPNLQYQLISSYSGGSKSELRKSTAKTIDEAVDQTVRKIPGGEFLMNVKIYAIDSTFYAVEGDVWGVPLVNGYRGFKVGSKVSWNVLFKTKTGIVYALKDDEKCSVTDDETKRIVEIKYDDLTNIIQQAK
ncbi:MAG: hypothetical protein WCK78_18725 [Paludibacter sp.]